MTFYYEVLSQYIWNESSRENSRVTIYKVTLFSPCLWASFHVLGLLCSCWLSRRSDVSYLHRVRHFFSLFLFIFFFGLCLHVFSFALYFWWMGSHPWFLYRVFLFLSPPLSLILAVSAKYENFIRSQYEMLKLGI
jgi:glucan phosphoethanolaminetransferase (alkaline phosphatase superfamily)